MMSRRLLLTFDVFKDMRLVYNYVHWFQFLQITQNCQFFTLISLWLEPVLLAFVSSTSLLFNQVFLFSLNNTLYENTCPAPNEGSLFNTNRCSLNVLQVTEGFAVMLDISILAVNAPQSTPGLVTRIYFLQNNKKRCLVRLKAGVKYR